MLSNASFARRLPNMSPRTRSVLRVASWLVATVIVVLLARGVDVGAIGRLLRTANTAWIAAAVGCNLLILPFWVQQWRALMPAGCEIAFPRMLPLVAMTAFMGNTVPGSGQVSTVLLLASEPNVTRTEAVSVLALDQLLEGVVKTGIVAAAASLLPLPVWMQRTFWLLATAVAVSLCALLFLAHQGRWLQQYVRALESLRSIRKLSRAVVWCVVSKSAEAAAIVCVQHAFAATVPLAVTLGVLAAVQLGTMVPLAPANIGTYEAGVMAVYQGSGLLPETALAVATVQHACLLFSTAGVGYLLFIFRRPASRNQSS